MVKFEILLVSFFISLVNAQIPLSGEPDWTSVDNDYSTGGAFADIDGNGYLDFCISNGNDMAYNYNSIYFNTGGVLEVNASWRSSDNGYFGHCYVGDINNDGLPDLAVGYLGAGTIGDFQARIYINNGSGLNPTPWWRSADRHSSFDCCLGDFDLDGDLDLAISAGDVYAPKGDSVRIYRNNGGFFDTLPCWVAEDSIPSDAIRFCDIDNDGDLELFVGHRGKVVMYENHNGVLNTRPSWVVREGIGWVLRLEFGDYDRDGFLDLAVASNGQLGDPNSIRVFHNNGGVLDTVASFTRQRNSIYSSCIAWGDVNGDGYPELAAGGWWMPVQVYANINGVLDTIAGWQWSPPNPNALVAEALIWSDVGNRYLHEVSEINSGNGRRRLFYLGHRPVQFMDSIKVNGTVVTPADYCCDLNAGWVSFARVPDSGIGNVVFYYRFAEYLDLAVTNWDRSNGNHLFLNTTQVGVAEVGSKNQMRVSVIPNPALGPVTIRFQEALSRGIPVSIYTQDGRLVRNFKSCGRFVVWDGRSEQGLSVGSGVYLVKAEGALPVKLVWLGR